MRKAEQNSSSDDDLSAAMEHHQAGRIREAESGYRRIVASDPQRAEAWHMLGILAAQGGQRDQAVDLIGRALEIRPEDPAYLTNLGVVFQGGGKIEQAIQCFRQVLRQSPNSPEAHTRLGSAELEGGHSEEAAASLHRALELDADYPEAHLGLGRVLSGQGRLTEAVSSLRRAIELRSDYPAAWGALGDALRDQNQFDESASAYGRALELKPVNPEVHNNLGILQRRKGQLNEAATSFRNALKFNDQLAPVHNNLGSALRDLGHFAKAAACYKTAIKLQPNVPEYYNNLGIVLHDLGQAENAMRCYREALQLRPDFSTAQNNLGTALQELGHLDEAAEAYRRSVEQEATAEGYTNLGNVLCEKGELEGGVSNYKKAIEMDNNQIGALIQLIHTKKKLCDWDGLPEMVNRVICAVEDGSGEVPPFLFINLPTDGSQQLRCARQYVAKSRQLTAAVAFERGREKRGKIRIGYLTAHVREHAMAFQVVELFERHNRDRFEIFGYHYGPGDNSAMRERMLAAFDGSTDFGSYSYLDSAKKIADDGIDILIDLVGHMHGARQDILAARPAPLQIMYLGYPGTSGAEYMDYVVVDEYLVPPEHAVDFSEVPIWLPDSFQINDSQREVAEVTPTRSECGLPESGFVFCCFNQLHKITEDIFDAWMKILASVDGSVLWLWRSNEHGVPNIRRAALRAGVDPDRIVFAPNQTMPEHLACYRVADLALDTTPYNGHGVTSEALWVGCPVVTVTGKAFASRVAGSVLRAVGCPELIAEDLDGYSRLAIDLATDNDRIRELRKRLERNRDTCPLFDTNRFVRNLEKGLEEVWSRYLAGGKPEPLFVAPD